MKILIIGGNRFAGRQLAETLLPEAEVTVFNRSGKGPEGATIIQGDRNTFEGTFTGFDVIIDFCLFKPDQAEKLANQLPTGQKYIFISSAAAYADQLNQYHYPHSKIGGRESFGEYGKEKAQCEQIVKNLNLDYTIIRPGYVVGPGSHRPRLSYYFHQILNGLPVDVDGDGEKLFSLIWIGDYVELLKLNIYKTLPHNSEINAAGTDLYSSKSLAKEVADFLKKSYTIKENGVDAPFQNEHLILTPSNTFIPLQERLSEFYTWYETEGKQKHGYK